MSKYPVRANGTGSVYYDSRSKRWIAQIVTGKYYTEKMKVRFTYKRKSFIKRTDALKAVQNLADQANERPSFTVSYYYNAFMAGKGSTLSADKQTAYRIAYNRLKTLWSIPVKDLTINRLQAVLNASCESYYTAKDVRTLLNKIFRLSAADDRSINPILPSLLELPKLQEKQVEPLTEEEILKLWISYDEGNEDASIPLILCYTGMMPGEIRKLTKSMIDLEAKEIIGVGMKTDERKKKSVLLPDDILPVLEDVISKAETDLLYPMHKETFYKRFHKVLQEAGFDRELSPYSCRHATATVLGVRERIPPQVLQRIMRWKSTKMMDRYVTPTDEDARKFVNKI